MKRVETAGSGGVTRRAIQVCSAVLLLGLVQAAWAQKKSGETRTSESTAIAVFNANRQSVVTVEATNAGTRTQGSAVVIRNGFARGDNDQPVKASSWLFTNAHVLNGIREVDISFGAFRAKAAVKYADKDRDLAILFAKDTVLPPAAMPKTRSDVQVGSSAFAIGSPKGLELSISAGLISGMRTVGGVNYLQTTAAIAPGSSGGGLFNSQGELIGITSFRLRSGDALNFALDIEEAKHLLKAHDAARMITIVAVDEKYHEDFGDEFTSWLSKGTSANKRHYIDAYEESERRLFAAPVSNEALQKQRDELLEIVRAYVGSSGASSRVDSQVNLVCNLFDRRGEPPTTRTFRIDLANRTVNGYPADVRDHVITFSYVGGNQKTFDVRLDRIASTATVGSAEFPVLASGACTRATTKSF